MSMKKRVLKVLPAVFIVAVVLAGCHFAPPMTADIADVLYQDLALAPLAEGAQVDRVIPLLTAWSISDEAHFVLGGDPDKQVIIPIMAFLVERGDRYLLVDTGMAPSLATDPSHYVGRYAAKLIRRRLDKMVMQPGWDVPGRIKKLGIDPQQVTDVVLTHAHFDHTGANRAFLHADFHLTAEIEQVGRHGSMLRGYMNADFPDEMKVERVDYSDTKPVLTFAGSHDLFGDGSVVLVPLPGHSPGSQGLLVRTQKQLVLLAGDAAYLRRNYEEPVMLGYYDDAEATWDTLCRLKRLSEEMPQILIWPSHDPEVYRRQPTAPEAL